MEDFKRQGLIRHIGITAHKIGVAEESIESGLYETLQFPFSYLSSERELALADKCREKNMGFIAMKALAGGIITDSRVAFAFTFTIRQHDEINSVSIVFPFGFKNFHELCIYFPIGYFFGFLVDNFFNFCEKFSVSRSDFLPSYSLKPLPTICV